MWDTKMENFRFIDVMLKMALRHDNSAGIQCGFDYCLLLNIKISFFRFSPIEIVDLVRSVG
jgi:hypothetical protein